MLRLSVSQVRFWRANAPGALDTNSLTWRELRRQTMLRDDYTCRFCGVRCARYMICDHIDRNPSHNDLTNLGVVCSLCKAIRHCGLSGIRGLLLLGISEMPQKDINLKTLALYSKDYKVPLYSEVDSKALIIADSTVDYANKLLELPANFDYQTRCYCSPAFHTFEMHKGFFKNNASSMLLQILENKV